MLLLSLNFILIPSSFNNSNGYVRNWVWLQTQNIVMFILVNYKRREKRQKKGKIEMKKRKVVTKNKTKERQIESEHRE